MAKVTIRQSQIAHTYAVGSIGDFPGVSAMFLSHDYEEFDWGKPKDELEDDIQPNVRRIINDKRLSDAFGIQNFVLPPLDSVSNNKIYVVRFPMSLYCPGCGRIHFVNDLENSFSGGLVPGANGQKFDESFRAFICSDCFQKSKRKIELVPTRFIIANMEGFIDDFPWDWYVHRKPDLRNHRGKGHKLYLKFGNASTSLGSISIISKDNSNKLVAIENLGEIFNQDKTFIAEGDEYLQYVKNRMPKPWLGRGGGSYVDDLIHDVPEQISRSGDGVISGDNEEIIKRKYPRTLQRGANNLFFPLVFKGIRLPEGTNNINQELVNSLTELKKQLSASQPDTYSNFSNHDWKSHFVNSYTFIPKLQQYEKSVFHKAVECIFDENNGAITEDKKQKLRLEEFECFSNSEIVKSDEIWYKARHVSSIGDYLKNRLKLEKITLLDKINELKIFRGFTRIKPLVNDDLIFETDKSNLSEKRLLEYDRICDARKFPAKTNELPCAEVKGEGIFLKFNNKELKEWENKKNVCSRFGQMKNNLSNYFITFDIDDEEVNISARYVFLHTLSHIIMQQLANDSGYSLSSLTEIIYCSKPHEKDEMNGILIYTSSSDTEGTLGGLVEKGEPNRLSPIISRGIDKAKWCSSDPLCVTSKGQGFMTTNMAACYSCVMVPETCCENINKFLDRKLVLDFFEIESL